MNAARVLLVAFLASPTTAWACAVCGGFSDDEKGAYIGTTALLSFLPLGLIFGGVYYVYRASQTHVSPMLERTESSDRSPQ